jgi:hypothetical protein
MPPTTPCKPTSSLPDTGPAIDLLCGIGGARMDAASWLWLMGLPFVTSMGSHDGGQSAQPRERQPSPANPAAVAPAGKPAKPAALEELLSSLLPECRSSLHVTPIDGPMARLVGKKVTVRGVLMTGPGWSCTCGSCSTTLRVVFAPKADKRPVALVIERKGERSWWVLEGIPAKRVDDSPDIDVMATGILHHTFQTSEYENFLLGRAEVCRAKADPKHPTMRLPHSPVRALDTMMRCDVL